jgi:glycosyltransferase involved in cell wall biosynthesis
MQIANCFIMPSEEEGFPRVSIEAMAAGTPVVSFDTGGLEEILEESLVKLVVKIGNIEKIRENIKEVLRNGKGFYSEKIKKQAEKFDLEVVKDKFLIYL